MSIELELAHFGVKGMKWGVRKNTTQTKRTRKEKRIARNGGWLAAKTDIGSTSPHPKTAEAMAITSRNINRNWKNHKNVDLFEKSKQKTYRRSMFWSGNYHGAVDASKRSGDAKTRAMARREEKHPNRWKVRRTVAAVAVISAVGAVHYRHAIKDQAHTTGQAVYNKIRKTSIDGIRSAARMAAEYERKKGR